MDDVVLSSPSMPFNGSQNVGRAKGIRPEVRLYLSVVRNRRLLPYDFLRKIGRTTSFLFQHTIQMGLRGVGVVRVPGRTRNRRLCEVSTASGSSATSASIQIRSTKPGTCAYLAYKDLVVRDGEEMYQLSGNVLTYQYWLITLGTIPPILRCKKIEHIK